MNYLARDPRRGIDSKAIGAGRRSDEDGMAAMAIEAAT